MVLQRSTSGGDKVDLEKSSATANVQDAATVSRVDPPGSVSDSDNKRILRKIDCNIMPLLCFVYLIQFLDKTSLSYASIMGLREDNDLSLSEYSWLSSIFYLAYLVGEWPTNWALQRLPLAKYTSANVILWGVVLACTAVTTDFKGLMVVRFFLGLLEACVSPAFTLVTSQWYKKNEQGTRIGIWFAQNAMGNMLGAFLAWGLAKHDRAGEFSIAGWKVLFICLGGLTVVLGIVLLVFLPDSPRTARFLSEPDRALAVERIKGNQTGIGNKTHKWPQVKEALLDPLTWLYCLYSVALSIFNGGVTSFFSIIIASLGYGPLDSLLYGAPGGAVLLVSVITLMHLGDRLRKRLLCGILSLCISLLGVLLIWLLPTEIKVGRLIGYYLSLVATVGFIVVLSLLSSNVSGSSKKTTVSALFFIFYAVGNLIGPQTFRAQDAPRYGPALATFAAVIGFGMADLALIWWLNARENRRRDEAARDKGYEQQQEVNADELDLTDRENPAFRYVC
ncbi:permease of the major facilitator superfamily [Rhodotorula diobovata]|uniref:Permease of the major facilitator superfamily n=1 Tax=Rhodotorula diobovata TaxID=5288 RepID=A0A5C5G5B4_9BASI|nr:permease of the major facilitator superfamily [Rhodotorula diobovata]